MVKLCSLLILITGIIGVAYAGSLNDNVNLAPDGTYVGGDPTLASDGSYVGGEPELAPDGTYVGRGNED